MALFEFIKITSCFHLLQEMGGEDGTADDNMVKLMKRYQMLHCSAKGKRNLFRCISTITTRTVCFPRVNAIIFTHGHIKDY